MTAYYNEFEPYAAQWLKNLINAKLIADGEVDTRSILDVRASDLKGYTQCHFFAGIGGWSHALRLAGWDDSRPVWTGSCPCQPFSVAGRGTGTADERHFWPVWFNLIRECNPETVFGEQVEAAIRHGWLDLVQTDLEGIGYAFAPVCVPAASVGAPHIRNRLWFGAQRVAYANTRQRIEQIDAIQTRRDAFSIGGTVLSMARPKLPDEARFGQERISVEPQQETRRSSDGDPWAFDAVIKCADRRTRPIKSSVYPMANGVSNRVGRLRAYGNAIVPQVAAEVISAFMECHP